MKMQLKRVGYAFIFALQLLSINSFAQITKLLDLDGAQGRRPLGSLISDGTFLYGMTSQGGSSDFGTIFKIMPDGTGYVRLFNFTGGANGSGPLGSLIYDGTFLYGMTNAGGTNNFGIIFKILPNGTGFTKLLDFTGTANGSNPTGTLTSDGTFFYGMTQTGGTNNLGTIFKIMPDGTGFSKLLDFAGVDGRNPFGSLISDGTFLYGMTGGGGTIGGGTIFKIMPDGTGYTKLLDFTGTANGANPNGSLILDGAFLYGMTGGGGANGAGTIFKIMRDGTGYIKLHDFTVATGGSPQGSFISDGTFLYGMTGTGGTGGFGTVFKIMFNGTGFVTLLDFAGLTNGGSPYGDVFSDGTFLYGMTYGGSTNNNGTIFKIMADGTGYVKLLDFALAANGRWSSGSLISDGTFLYGMTNSGGTNNLGTIFKIKPDGTGYTKLLDFAGANGNSPWGSLFYDGTFLYGMTEGGGTNGVGTIFKIMPDGTGFVKLLDFAGTSNGSNPQGSLISDGTFLYGMTYAGGTNNLGTIFKLMPDGTGYVKLLDYAGVANGSNPTGSLISNATFLYGMTNAGGTNNMGTIFKIMHDGTGYAKLLDFAGAVNGRIPRGDLITDGTFLYGMTQAGSTNNRGNIFRIMLNGTSYATLFDFTGIPQGSSPTGSLIYDGTFLYGMTYAGGTSDYGIIFRIRPNGTSYLKLADFAGLTTGNRPWGSLISDGVFFYGITQLGGTTNFGTVFKFLIPPLPPTITSFTPTSASTGTTVTITGTNFTGATVVRFGGIAATSFNVVSPTSITAVVGTGASGTVAVTTPVGTASLAGFTFITCTPPLAPSAPSVSRCGSGTVILIATGASGSQEYRWYNVASGGTSLGSTASFTTPIIAITTTYYVSIFDVATSCESNRTPVNAIVNTPPAAPTAINNSGCSGTSISIAVSGGTNGQYRWYTTSTGGTAIVGETSDTYPTPTLTNTTSYFVAINDNTCESTRAEVIATVLPLPVAPIVSPINPVCPGSSLTITASGGVNGDYRWYDGNTLLTGEVNSTYPVNNITATRNFSVSIFDGSCESLKTPATITLKNCSPPVIASSTSTAFLESTVAIDLCPLLSDPENDLDISTLQATGTLSSGAPFVITNCTLSINYAGIPFPGTDELAISVCDLTGLCTDQLVSIELSGDIEVYNALSPNGDGKNDSFYIQYISILPETKNNKVQIYNRWGDVVWETDNYDNTERVFTGLTTNGKELPSGTYYYKLTTASSSKTGFLSLKR